MENRVQRCACDLSWLAVELVANAEEECAQPLDEWVNAGGLGDGGDELVELATIGKKKLTTCRFELSERNSVTDLGESQSHVERRTRYPTMTRVQSSSSDEPTPPPSLVALLAASPWARAAIMRLPTTSWRSETLSSSSSPPPGNEISRASFLACSELRSRCDIRRHEKSGRYGSNGASLVWKSSSPDMMSDPADWGVSGKFEFGLSSGGATIDEIIPILASSLFETYPWELAPGT